MTIGHRRCNAPRSGYGASVRAFRGDALRPVPIPVLDCTTVASASFWSGFRTYSSLGRLDLIVVGKVGTRPDPLALSAGCVLHVLSKDPHFLCAVLRGIVDEGCRHRASLRRCLPIFQHRCRSGCNGEAYGSSLSAAPPPEGPAWNTSTPSTPVGAISLGSLVQSVS